MKSNAGKRESEETSDSIVDISYDWEMFILPDGSYDYVSPGCELITGCSPEEFVENPDLILDIIHPEDRKKFNDHQLSSLNSHCSTAEVEFRVIDIHGEVRWFWHKCQSVFSSDGQWQGRRIINREVTLLKETAKRFLQEQRLLNTGPTVVFRWKAVEGWPVEYVSVNIQQVFGYSPIDLLSGRIVYSDIIHPDDLKRVVTQVSFYSQSTKNQFSQEYRLIDANGTIRWVFDQTNVLRDDSGKVIYYHGYLLDISKQKQTEEALKLSETQLKKTQHLARIGYWHWNHQLSKINITDEVYALLNLEASTFNLNLRNIFKLIDPADRRRLISFFKDIKIGTGSANIEFRIQKDEGCYVVVRVEYEDAFDNAGNVIGKHGSCQDITDFKQTETQLLLFDKIFTNTVEGIAITDSKGIIQKINPAGQRITGFDQSELVGENMSTLRPEKHSSKFYKKRWDTFLTTGFWQGEIWSRRKNGEIYPLQMSMTSLSNGQNQVNKVVYVFHDMTEIKTQAKEIQFQTYHDALTGLPNRLLFLDRLKVALRHAKEPQSKLAVIVVDIDDFRLVNDSLGHETGDLLLQQAALRIKECVRENDTVARQGSDDFIVLLENLIDLQIATDTAERIIEKFRAPFIIDNQECFFTVSAGIAVAPEDGESENILLSNADLAMYRAKKEGKNSYCFFTKELNERIKQRFTLSTQLRHAVKNEEFIVYYQPKMDIAKRCIVGVEALVRWEPEPGNTIAPFYFIPLAESTGLIVPLGRFVLTTACNQAAEWYSKGLNINMAVNLSPRQFAQEDFLDSVKEALHKSGLPPSMLELEITETLMMENEDIAIGQLWELKKMGIKISVDDFGTGYSSLAYLKQLPIDILKIDRSFVKDLPADKDDVVLTSTIINMAKSLGLDIVAEGVETVEQLQFMCERECHLVQGYFFSPPVSANNMDVLLKKSTDSFFEGFVCGKSFPG